MNKKRLWTILFILVLAASLFVNYTKLSAQDNVHINGGSDPSFSVWNDEVVLSVDGCLLWADEKLRSKEIAQYWKIRATSNGRSATCSLIEGTQMGEDVIISNAEDCAVSSIDANAKIATIKYKDAVITINGDRTIWATIDPAEKGGGEFVHCTDKRLNWYLFE